jgi:hypothetical protein
MAQHSPAPPTRVLVLQTDNRPALDYLQASRRVNEAACAALPGFAYRFEPLATVYQRQMFPATEKLFAVRDALAATDADVLVFLDSDAWIQDAGLLAQLVGMLAARADKHGAFSRDPYLEINTYVNSGSFVLKVNDHTRRMYADITAAAVADRSKWHSWPFDQFYVSNHVHAHRADFLVFKPPVLNTPRGAVLRHNWRKNAAMWADMAALLAGGPSELRDLDWADAVDDEPFPNPHSHGEAYP